MKVILLKDIAKIGKKDEVREVPNGHALNHLIPQGAAEAATPHSLKALTKRQEQTTAEQEGKSAAFKDMLEKLQGSEISLPMEANEQGHLFKGIHIDDIAQHLSSKGFDGIDVSMIDVAEPIKEVGSHEVTLSLGDDHGTFTLLVKAK